MASGSLNANKVVSVTGRHGTWWEERTDRHEGWNTYVDLWNSFEWNPILKDIESTMGSLANSAWEGQIG